MSVKLGRVSRLNISWVLSNQTKVKKKGREVAEPICGWIARSPENTALLAGSTVGPEAQRVSTQGKRYLRI